ncbi:MAG: hypothetical protein ACE5KH_06520 [Candidatus Geothermarchaeales archaeon]
MRDESSLMGAVKLGEEEKKEEEKEAVTLALTGTLIYVSGVPVKGY